MKKIYKRNKVVVWGLLILVLIIAGLIYNKVTAVDGEFDEFARCINNSGTKFYGTFWCEHCKNQKEEFGKSAKYLPYIECSIPNGQGTNLVCLNANIEGYPTWEFPDGTRESGELSLEFLAERTSCSLPGQDI